MRRLVAVSVCSLVWAAAASPAQTPNVVGTFVRPALTGCGGGSDPCDPAPRGAMLTFVRDGTVSSRIRVATNGRFALRLAPGKYTVSAYPTPEGRRLVPGTFRVPATGVVRLRLRMS
jgi:hypothetical protein